MTAWLTYCDSRPPAATTGTRIPTPSTCAASRASAERPGPRTRRPRPAAGHPTAIGSSSRLAPAPRRRPLRPHDLRLVRPALCLGRAHGSHRPARVPAEPGGSRARPRASARGHGRDGGHDVVRVCVHPARHRGGRPPLGLSVSIRVVESARPDDVRHAVEYVSDPSAGGVVVIAFDAAGTAVLRARSRPTCPRSPPRRRAACRTSPARWSSSRCHPAHADPADHQAGRGRRPAHPASDQPGRPAAPPPRHHRRCPSPVGNRPTRAQQGRVTNPTKCCTGRKRPRPLRVAGVVDTTAVHGTSFTTVTFARCQLEDERQLTRLDCSHRW